MDGELKSVDVNDVTGGVSVLRIINGENWRRGITRHDFATLDRVAPEISQEKKAEITALWDRLGPLPPDEL